MYTIVAQSGYCENVHSLLFIDISNIGRSAGSVYCYINLVTCPVMASLLAVRKLGLSFHALEFKYN